MHHHHQQQPRKQMNKIGHAVERELEKCTACFDRAAWKKEFM